MLLSLVQSIANQTFRQADNLAEAAETYSSRLVSLGRATDILTETAWADASLHSLAQAGLISVGDFSERIRISGPDLDLAPQQALMLTLTLHELATNSLKYGAPSLGDGVGGADVGREEGCRWRRAVHAGMAGERRAGDQRAQTRGIWDADDRAVAAGFVSGEGGVEL